MLFEEYQKQSRKTAIYPDAGKNLTYPMLGLAGETGELLNKFKKVFRDHGGVMTPELQQALGQELGDILWYVSQVASELGINLEEVAQKNLEKLFSRMERGTLQGSGDQR